MTDLYAGSGDDLLGPASSAAAVTPGASPLPFASKRLWVGAGGNVEVTTVGGQTVTYTNVPAGTYLYVRAAYVLSAPGGDVIAEY